MAQKDKILLLPVKSVSQENCYECGLSAVMTILKTMGMKVRKDNLKKKLGTSSRKGTPPENIKALFTEIELEYQEKHKASLRDVEKMLKASKMCLVAYQAWGEEKYYKRLQSGHYSVIFGAEGEYFWLADPYVRHSKSRYGRGVRKIKKETFLGRWKDIDYKGVVYDRWMLAV